MTCSRGRRQRERLAEYSFDDAGDAGSATAPRPSEHIVMPSCAPASIRVSSRNRRAHVPARRSPSAASCSILERREASSANSEATKNPFSPSSTTAQRAARARGSRCRSDLRRRITTRRRRPIRSSALVRSGCVRPCRSSSVASSSGSATLTRTCWMANSSTASTSIRTPSTITCVADLGDPFEPVEHESGHGVVLDPPGGRSP